MTVQETIRTRRTIRKFRQDPINRDTLEQLVDCARLAPSANNIQPLKYAIVDDPQLVSSVFAQVRWAGYLVPAYQPAEDQRPTAFICIFNDTTVRKDGYELDAGAAAQSIMTAAWEEGIGSCWMGAIIRPEICALLEIPDSLILNTVIALGYADEEPVVEEIPADGSIKYWKDEEGRLHVPKRSLSEVLLPITNYR